MIHRIHHLNCGSLCPMCAPLFGQRGLTAHLVCHCLLLETDRGLVLVDTGLGLQDLSMPRARIHPLVKYFGNIQRSAAQTAIRQIEQLGFQARDVRHILLSHLDFDHAGGVSDFPHATVHVMTDEYSVARKPSLKNQLRYRPAQFMQHQHWNFVSVQHGEAWFNFQRVQGLAEFADDILLIPLRGHTLGHMGIAIRQASGWLLYCGDAYLSQRELDAAYHHPALALTSRIFAQNNRLRLKNLSHLQTLAATQPNLEIICAHDPATFAQYRAIPQPNSEPAYAMH